MKYKFKYKKGLFYRTILASGHQYHKETDRMDVYHVDGTITSLANWSKYDLRLDQDWVRATKEQMEKESGQEIKLKTGNS